MTITVLELPTEAFPNYSYTTTLDEKEYKLNFRFDVHQSSWYLTISKLDGVVLLAGVKMVPWLDLLFRYTKEELPLGNLYLVPVSATYPSSPDITLANFATDFQLLYNSVT